MPALKPVKFPPSAVESARPGVWLIVLLPSPGKERVSEVLRSVRTRLGYPSL